MHQNCCSTGNHCFQSNGTNFRKEYDFNLDTLKMIDKKFVLNEIYFRLVGRLNCYKEECDCHLREECCECEHEPLCLKQVRRLTKEEQQKRDLYEEWWEHKAIRGQNDYRNIEHCKCAHCIPKQCHENHSHHHHHYNQDLRNCTVVHAKNSALSENSKINFRS